MSPKSLPWARQDSEHFICQYILWQSYPEALLLSPLYRWENWGTVSVLFLGGLVSFSSYRSHNFLGLLAAHVSHTNRPQQPAADNAEAILAEISVSEILTASLRLGLLVPSNGWEYLGSVEPCSSRAPK